MTIRCAEGATQSRRTALCPILTAHPYTLPGTPHPNTVVDRSAQPKTWVDYLQPITRRGVTIFAYANNHYSGHAPDTVKLFREFWDKKK